MRQLVYLSAIEALTDGQWTKLVFSRD